MSPERLDELISGHFDRALDTAGRSELERALCTDPAAARRFAAWARLHANLHHAAADEAAGRAPADDSPLPPVAGPGHRRRSSWSALAIAALVLLALGGLWWLRADHRGPLAEIAHAEGTLLVDGHPVADGARIVTGATIGTGLEDGATLRLRDGSEVVLDRDTRLGLDRIEGEWRLRLDAGEVECSVARQAPGEGFVLRTPEATVAVVGTRFLVEHRDGRSAVRVTEGTVTFAAGGKLLRLGPSDRAVVSGGVVTTDLPSEAVLGGEPAVWRLGFETSEDLGRLHLGRRIATGGIPPGNRSQWAIAAEEVRGRDGGRLLQMALRDTDRALFTVEEDLVIRVRYWANREAGWLGVWLATDPWAAHQHYHREFTPITDRWVTTTIPLRDVTRDPTGLPPAPGDRVVHLMFQSDGREGARLYIDDVSVERP